MGNADSSFVLIAENKNKSPRKGSKRRLERAHKLIFLTGSAPWTHMFGIKYRKELLLSESGFSTNGEMEVQQKLRHPLKNPIRLRLLAGSDFRVTQLPLRLKTSRIPRMSRWARVRSAELPGSSCFFK